MQGVDDVINEYGVYSSWVTKKILSLNIREKQALQQNKIHDKCVYNIKVEKHIKNENISGVTKAGP